MEYEQEDIGPGVLNRKPGERVREALGGGGDTEAGQGLQPGKRVQDALQRFRGDGEEASQGMLSELNIPDNPGPAAAGRTPLVGTLRRSQGMPVARDELGNMLSG